MFAVKIQYVILSTYQQIRLMVPGPKLLVITVATIWIWYGSFFFKKKQRYIFLKINILVLVYPLNVIN